MNNIEPCLGQAEPVLREASPSPLARYHHTGKALGSPRQVSPARKARISNSALARSISLGIAGRAYSAPRRSRPSSGMPGRAHTLSFSSGYAWRSHFVPGQRSGTREENGDQNAGEDKKSKRALLFRASLVAPAASAVKNSGARVVFETASSHVSPRRPGARLGGRPRRPSRPHHVSTRGGPAASHNTHQPAGSHHR